MHGYVWWGRNKKKPQVGVSQHKNQIISDYVKTNK